MSVQQAGAQRRGLYYAKREYRDKPLPEWVEARLRLPAPQLPEEEQLVDAYWQAWEAIFTHFRRPVLGSRLVSNFLDPCAGGRLRMWDLWATSSFCDLAHDVVPGIRGFDNFYAAQHEDGEICRELDFDGHDIEAWVNAEHRPLFSRQTGRAADLDRLVDAIPELTLDGMAHPLTAWAEWESYRQTADAERVAEVWPALLHQYEALRAHLRHSSGLFVTDWAAMDNSPRNVRLLCGVDSSCQMLLFTRALAEMAPIAARDAEARGRFQEGVAARRRAVALEAEAVELAAAIQRHLWDEQSGFFYDLRTDGTRSDVPTAAAFWTLIAGVASEPQAAALAAWLSDPATFGRLAGVPSLSAAAPGFDPRGGYFRGAVWPPLMLMVCRGLARGGRFALARDLAMRHVRAAAQVAADTGTFYENYAPDEVAPGRPARGDVLGWGGVGPITLLLEFGLGLRANAPADELHWNVATAEPCGCQRYYLHGMRVSVQAEGRSSVEAPLHIRVEAERPVRLVVNTAGRRVEFPVRGRQEFTV